MRWILALVVLLLIVIGAVFTVSRRETPPVVRIEQPDRAVGQTGTLVVTAYAGSALERDEALALRLARFVGRRLTRRIAGRLIPFAAIAFNAIGNERETRALADKAITFYGG